MKRILVIGSPGSGKSRFSKALAAITGFPLYHLDRIYWREDKSHLDREEFHAALQSLMEGEHWILDGHYASSLEYRLRGCDGVIYMDYPTEVCLQGLRERAGHPRSDSPPWVTPDSDATELVAYVASFAKEQRPGIYELLERYSRKETIVLHSRKEADELLAYWERTYKKK